MITIVAKATLKPGKKAEFKAAVQKMIAGSQAEAGNISYDLFEDIDNEDTVAFIEQWTDQVAIDAHSNTHHFKAGFAAIEDLMYNMEIIKYNKI